MPLHASLPHHQFPLPLLTPQHRPSKTASSKRLINRPTKPLLPTRYSTRRPTRLPTRVPNLITRPTRHPTHNKILNCFINGKQRQPMMITFNLNLEFGAYNTVYSAVLARWPWLSWPIDANVVVKLTPLTLELKASFNVQGFKMEITAVRLS
jgi:hypothetical protein